MTKARDLANLGSVAAYNQTFRNRIINGSALIQQRAMLTVSTAVFGYATDRVLSGLASGTGVNVSMFKSTFGGSSSYSAHYIYGSMTNGTPYWAQRIEAANVTDLNNKTVTVSGLLYQDTGSTQSFNARLARSGTLDNWSGTVTSIATSANISVPSGVVTPFSATFTLGATDATNGLMVEVFTSNTVTCTNKNFALSDWQLELGSVKTPYEMRPIGVELALCQRYYEKSTSATTAPANGALSDPRIGVASAYYPGVVETNAYKFVVTKRVAPTVTYYNGSAFATASQWALFNGVWNQGATVSSSLYDSYFNTQMSISGLTSGQCWIVSGMWAASAEL